MQKDWDTTPKIWRVMGTVTYQVIMLRKTRKLRTVVPINMTIIRMKTMTMSTDSKGSHTMVNRLTIPYLAILLVSSCVNAPELRPTGADHPANPHAPAAPVPARSTTFESQPESERAPSENENQGPNHDRQHDHDEH